MPVSVYYFNKIIIMHNNFSSKLYLDLQSEPKTTKTPLANKTRIRIFIIELFCHSKSFLHFSMRLIMLIKLRLIYNKDIYCGVAI